MACKHSIHCDCFNAEKSPCNILMMDSMFRPNPFLKKSFFYLLKTRQCKFAFNLPLLELDHLIQSLKWLGVGSSTFHIERRRETFHLQFCGTPWLNFRLKFKFFHLCWPFIFSSTFWRISSKCHSRTHNCHPCKWWTRKRIRISGVLRIPSSDHQELSSPVNIMSAESKKHCSEIDITAGGSTFNLLGGSHTRLRFTWQCHCSCWVGGNEYYGVPWKRFHQGWQRYFEVTYTTSNEGVRSIE